MEKVVNFVRDFGKRRCHSDGVSGDTVGACEVRGNGREVVGSDQGGVVLELLEPFWAN